MKTSSVYLCFLTTFISHDISRLPGATTLVITAFTLSWMLFHYMKVVHVIYLLTSGEIYSLSLLWSYHKQQL